MCLLDGLVSDWDVEEGMEVGGVSKGEVDCIASPPQRCVSVSNEGVPQCTDTPLVAYKSFLPHLH